MPNIFRFHLGILTGLEDNDEGRDHLIISRRRRPYIRTFVNTKRHILPTLITRPFQPIRPKFIIPNILRTHGRKSLHRKVEDAGVPYKTLAVKKAPPIDILANRKSHIAQKPIIGPSLKIAQGHLNPKLAVKKSRVLIPKLIKNEIPSSLMKEINNFESHEIRSLNGERNKVPVRKPVLKQPIVKAPLLKKDHVIQFPKNVELIKVPDRKPRFSIPKTGAKLNVPQPAVPIKQKKVIVMTRITHGHTKVLNKGNLFKKSNVRPGQEMDVFSGGKPTVHKSINLDDLSNKGHFTQKSALTTTYPAVAKTSIKEVNNNKFTDEDDADDDYEATKKSDVVVNTRIVDRGSLVDKTLRKKTQDNEAAEARNKVHNVVSDDIDETEAVAQTNIKDKRLDSRNNLHNRDIHFHEVKYDVADVKNNSNHQAKLIDLNSPVKKIKPDEMKESKSDDDEECSAQAMKKGLCVNDIQFPQPLNKKIGTDSSKGLVNTKPVVETTAMKKNPSKTSTGCSCPRSESGACTCDAPLTATDGTIITTQDTNLPCAGQKLLNGQCQQKPEPLPTGGLPAATAVECDHQLPNSNCPVNEAASSTCPPGDTTCSPPSNSAGTVAEVAPNNNNCKGEGCTPNAATAAQDTSLGGSAPVTQVSQENPQGSEQAAIAGTASESSESAAAATGSAPSGGSTETTLGSTATNANDEASAEAAGSASKDANAGLATLSASTGGSASGGASSSSGSASSSSSSSESASSESNGGAASTSATSSEATKQPTTGM